MQVTAVSPNGKVEPEVKPSNDWQVTGTDAPYWSTAVGGVQVTTAPDAEVAFCMMLGGVPEITGAIAPALTDRVGEAPEPVSPEVSETETVKPQLEVMLDGEFDESYENEGTLPGLLKSGHEPVTPHE
jgi:hypothetical protein